MSSAANGSLTISVEEAYRLQKDPRTTFLDVRSPSEFAVSHIVGALNVPINQLESSVDQLSKERPLIVYCDNPDEARSISRHVVQLLRSKGYNAFFIAGGLDAWRSARFKVAESG